MHDQAFQSKLAAEVRRRREELGLRQVELAELARCSTRFVHTVEAGKSTVRLDKLLAVLRVLGIRLRLAVGDEQVSQESRRA
jgi:y4mF family transcriptional regulator